MNPLLVIYPYAFGQLLLTTLKELVKIILLQNNFSILGELLMTEVYFGDAIRRKREALKMTQSELADGICERVTISRLENGIQIPGHRLMTALLDRLDLPADKYVTYLHKNEVEIEQLRHEIMAGNVLFQKSAPAEQPNVRKSVLALHDKLSSLSSDVFTQQFLERSRLILGGENGPFPVSEQRERLIYIARLTNSKFDPQKIENGLYTSDDIRIINQIGITYIQEQRHLDAIRLYDQLNRYIEEHFHEISPIKVCLPMVLFNYSQELTAIGEYQNANQMAHKGYDICTSYGHFQYIPGLLASMGESFFFLGNKKESEEYYRLAYYTFLSFRDFSGLEAVKKDILKYLGIDFQRNSTPAGHE